MSNKKDYVHQMTMWLGRQKAVAQFRAYLDYVAALDIISNDGLDSDLDDNEEETEELAHLSSRSIHSIAVKPTFPCTDVNTLATSFKATNFIPTLSIYIH